MPDAGALLGILLVYGAVALAAVFGIAVAAVFIVGPRRQSAIPGPFLAGLITAGLLVADGYRLGFDLTASAALVAAVAVGVAVPQRLENAARGSLAWLVGWVGNEAWVGAAQGFFFGVAASWVSRDWRLLWLMILAGAAIRGIWAAVERPSSEPVESARLPASDVIAPSGSASAREVPEPAQVGVSTRSLGMDSDWEPLGLTTKLVGVVLVVMLLGAGIALVTSSGGYRGPHVVTVFNRTTTPIAFGDLFGGGAFVDACGSATFSLDGGRGGAGAGASTGSVVPPNAIVVKLPLNYGAAEVGPPPAQSIVVRKDGAWVDSSGASPGALPPCEGVAKSRVEFSGDGDFTSQPIRLSGSYSAHISIIAGPSTGCDFSATVSNATTVIQLAKPFTVPADGRPAIDSYPSFPDATYRLAVVSGCRWEIRLEP
ncbi:MAG: hypothetical protein HY263_03070 [Chloroflexi bacterium]|nr:hypothetical protein [Chloroflexota bacterium]